MLPAPCFLPLPETEGGDVTDMPEFPTGPVSESRPSAGKKSSGTDDATIGSDEI